MIDCREVRPLGQGYSPLFQSWLEQAGPDGATGALQRAIAATGPRPCRLARAGWRPGPEVSGDLPADQLRRLQDNVRRLAAGAADVVVTGQQPGFLGGPLYTLYKIATAVALARRRTAAGLPTVPVFWSADDDTDLGEALAAVAWNPEGGTLQAAGARDLKRDPSWRRRMVGTLPCPQVCAGAATTGSGVEADALRRDLQALLHRSVTEDWSLGRLNTAAWYRCFAGTDLIIVSGDDPELHRAAGPLTRKLRPRTAELAALARQRGRQLAAEGGHAQLDERSLRTPWYRSEGLHRLPLDPHQDVADARLRPGVLMRSLVQDWLLAPVAVVVGPGEYAYLRQLEPVYAAAAIPRCPLVPRMVGTIVPVGRLDLARTVLAGPRQQARIWADAYLARATDQLSELLQEELGQDAAAARRLAAGRTRRWRRGLVAMMANLAREASRPGGTPAWVHPRGVAQERSLAAFNALLLWGDPLLAAVDSGADFHITQGAAGLWRGLAWEVEEPGGP